MSKILIIDDEQEICALLSGMLRKKKYKVDSEHTIKEGFNALKQNEYDLVFLDLNLTDGSGFDLLPKIQAYDPSIEVVVISAYDGMKERKHAYKMGASGFISKPFSMQDIEETIQEKENKNNLKPPQWRKF